MSANGMARSASISARIVSILSASISAGRSFCTYRDRFPSGLYVSDASLRRGLACQRPVRNRTGARALIDDRECKHSRVGGASMMTKQNLSKIADVVLVSLLALAAGFV